MLHLGILVDLTDLNAESKQKNADAGESYAFWSKLKFLEQVPFDREILDISGPDFTKIT